MIIASSDEPNKVVENMNRILRKSDCNCIIEDEREVDYTVNIGDYHIRKDDDVIVVERKTWSDYTNSLIDPNQRLKSQHFDMSANANVSYIIITDYLSFAMDSHKRLSLKPVISSLMGDTLKVANKGKKSRVNVITLENPKQFAYALWALNKKLQDGDLTRKAPLRRKRITSADPCVKVLAGIKRIGRNKANKLLAKFGSPLEVGNASVRELATIKGIGESTARKIKLALTGEMPDKPTHKNEFDTDSFFER